MVAWKNGKCGLIGIDHLIYLPLEYDRIFKNGYSFTRDSNYEMVDKFIVLEQNKRYGIIEFDGSRKITKFVQPDFPAMPTRYYPRYNGMREITLFALSTAEEVTFAYALENGKVFLK